MRTIFNFLGPLTNPAGARRQLIGVSDLAYLETMAGALALLGTDHALLVSSEDGLDELSISAATRVVEVTAASCASTRDPGGGRRSSRHPPTRSPAATRPRTPRSPRGDLRRRAPAPPATCARAATPAPRSTPAAAPSRWPTGVSARAGGDRLAAPRRPRSSGSWPHPASSRRRGRRGERAAADRRAHAGRGRRAGRRGRRSTSSRAPRPRRAEDAAARSPRAGGARPVRDRRAQAALAVGRA